MNLNTLNTLVKENPELLELSVVYSRDDEGNGFQEVHYNPSVGVYLEEDREFYSGDIVEHFCNFDRDEFIKLATDRAITTFALLKDGVWYEKGKMGWWATVSDEKMDWNYQFTKLFNELDDDVRVTIVDCHI